MCYNPRMKRRKFLTLSAGTVAAAAIPAAVVAKREIVNVAPRHAMSGLAPIKPEGRYIAYDTLYQHLQNNLNRALTEVMVHGKALNGL